MLLSTTSAAYIPRCYNMDLHLEAQCHLVHSDPLPPALVSLSPYRAKSGLSRQLSPIARVHSSHPVLLQSSPDAEVLTPSSVAAVAAAIRRASPSSPVEFTRRVEKQGGLVLPSSDFQRICFDQLALFRMVVDPNVILSVYVRPAGNYVMDQLELRCVSNYPTTDMSEGADCVILVGNFTVPASLQAVEAALLKQQAEVISESRAIVLPMVKHPFVVGFLVAELPKMDLATSDNLDNDQKDVPFYSSDDGALPNTPYSNKKPLEIQTFREDLTKACEQFTTEKRSRAIMISRSLATAYVMDQKGMLLQQSSWQNNVRMNHLIEQIRGPLSSIRALTKMLSVHIKRSEISYDIIEDLLVQGDHMKDALQQLQDSVYLTKVNIARCNEETLKKTLDLKSSHPELLRSLPSDNGSSVINTYSSQKELLPLSLSSGKKDLEMPMPPLWLVPLQQNSIRPCIVSDILEDLVGVALPLAIRQQRGLELNELSQFLEVAVEESSLRQALSNLIEGALLRTQIGGKVQIYAAEAPAGGALVIIDDDGPDMHYMTQMRSLAPFGAELVSEGMVEDNITWNFIAGLTIAREILENYGCIVRVNSPRIPDAPFSTGGTRIEIWFPALQSNSMDQVEQL
ncbi:chloroplast sensor kinase, chloroplastic-like isoform X2 [Zingiber officinale]|uniref:chloroplast sensor kinase, chloroplastic-like isoform X2 n=1 Tax=Zingiber officinale TaxID=94328 RepID=UPI001C4D15C5|nr:chloroplast sensor kinase, chloroplastic-like isoform X2 [Zingiber officinale]